MASEIEDKKNNNTKDKDLNKKTTEKVTKIHPDKTYRVSTGKGSRDPVLVIREMTFAGLAHSCSVVKQGGKDGVFFLRGETAITKGRGLEDHEIAAGYKDYLKEDHHHRNNRTLINSHFLTIDGDATIGGSDKSAPSALLAHEILKKHHLNHFIFTTHSHSADKNRWRLMVECPIQHDTLDDNKSALKETTAALIQTLNDEGCMVANAKESSTWGQLWFTPTRDSIVDGQFQFLQYLEGKLYKALPPLDVEQYKKQRQSEMLHMDTFDGKGGGRVANWKNDIITGRHTHHPCCELTAHYYMTAPALSNIEVMDIIGHLLDQTPADMRDTNYYLTVNNNDMGNYWELLHEKYERPSAEATFDVIPNTAIPPVNDYIDTSSEVVDGPVDIAEPTDIPVNVEIDNLPPLFDNTPPPVDEKANSVKRLNMKEFSSDWLAPHDAPRVYYPLLNNLLPRNQVGFLFGESGAYKSYLVLDMVMSSMYKSDWAGHQIAANKKSTLWVAGEGKEETPDRIDAWLQDNNIKRGEQATNGDGEPISLRVYNEPLELHSQISYGLDVNDGSFDKFEEYVKRNSERIDLVILDTFSALFSGDDSDRVDVVRVLNRLQRMSRQYEVTFLIVHHLNKDGASYRGSGAITADSDFNFKVLHEYNLAEGEKKASETSERTGRVSFRNTQQKTQTSGATVYFRPRVVPVVGFISGFGEQVSQVVMDYQTGIAALPQPKRQYDKKEKFGVKAMTRLEQKAFLHEVLALLKEGTVVGIEYLDLFKKYQTFRRGNNKLEKTKNKQAFLKSVNRLVDLKCIDMNVDGKDGKTWYSRGEEIYLDESKCIDIKEKSPFKRIDNSIDFLT